MHTNKRQNRISTINFAEIRDDSERAGGGGGEEDL